jgi:hypothetical protein
MAEEKERTIYSHCKTHNRFYHEMECPLCYEERMTCLHCRYSIKTMNPSGKCCHLYYPTYCEVCKAARKSIEGVAIWKAD